MTVMEFSNREEKETDTVPASVVGRSETAEQCQKMLIHGDGDGCTGKTDLRLDHDAQLNKGPMEGLTQCPTALRQRSKNYKKGHIKNTQTFNLGRSTRKSRHDSKKHLDDDAFGRGVRLSTDSVKYSRRQYPRSLKAEEENSKNERASHRHNVYNYHDPTPATRPIPKEAVGLPEVTVIGEMQGHGRHTTYEYEIDDDSSDGYVSAEETESIHDVQKDGNRVIAVWDRPTTLALAVFAALRFMYEVWSGSLELFTGLNE